METRKRFVKNQLAGSPIHSILQLNEADPEVIIVFNDEIDYVEVKHKLHSCFEFIFRNPMQIIETFLTVDPEQTLYSLKLISDLLKDVQLATSYYADKMEDIVLKLGPTYFSLSVCTELGIAKEKYQEAGFGMSRLAKESKLTACTQTLFAEQKENKVYESEGMDADLFNQNYHDVDEAFYSHFKPCKY